MQPPPSIEPNSSASIQNLTLTENLVGAAQEVTSRHRVLYEDREQRTTSDIVAIFGFHSEDQAKRGELLLCEILARANLNVVNDVIAAFQSRVPLILNPVAKSLKDIKDRVRPKDPILKKLRKIQRAVKKTQDAVAEYIEQIKRQTESQAWEQVAIAWVEMNHFLERIKDFRREILGVEVAIIRTPGSKPLGRLPTHPIEFAQIGPVVRTESVVCVSFDLFFDSWLNGFCRKIAEVIDPTCQYATTVDEMRLISKYDEFYNRCAPRHCHLSDDEKYDPTQLLRIETHSKKLIWAQGRLLKQMLGSDNEVTSSKSAKQGGGLPLNSNAAGNADVIVVAEIIKKSGQQARADIEAGASKLRETVKDLAEVLGKVSEALADPLVAAARDASVKKGVPHEFVWWVLQERHDGKFPTVDVAFKRCGLGSKRKKAGLPYCRNTVYRWLVKIKAELVKRGLMEKSRVGRSAVKVSNYDVGKTKDLNPSSVDMDEPPDEFVKWVDDQIFAGVNFTKDDWIAHLPTDSESMGLESVDGDKLRIILKKWLKKALIILDKDTSGPLEDDCHEPTKPDTRAQELPEGNEPRED